MGELPRRQSIPVYDSGSRSGSEVPVAADHRIHSLPSAATAGVAMEFEHPETNRTRLDRVSELYRQPDGSSLDGKGTQSRGVSGSRTVHTERRELRDLFDDREHRPAPCAQFAESNGG